MPAVVRKAPLKSVQCEIMGCKERGEWAIGAERPFSRESVLFVCNTCLKSIHACSQEILDPPKEVELTKRKR